MKDRNDFRTDLTVKNTEKSYVNGKVEIFGVVENHGEVDWEHIVIEAELFDRNGKFIDEITNRISVHLPPGASENFKISAKDFLKSRWQSIDNLKVKVSDAYHSKY